MNVRDDNEEDRYPQFLNPLPWEEEYIVGYRCSCLVKYIHPKEVIQQHYSNADKNIRLHNLTVVRQGAKLLRGKESVFVWVHHTTQSGEVVELHANLKYIKFG